ncbi:diguanylate cyclase [Kangiella spongicola]|nr:diguanylate cyclase [Kangiella spongicola]
MRLGPWFNSKRILLLWAAIICAALALFFYQEYRQLDKNYSILPVDGETPEYANGTIKWLVKRQHPDGYFVSNPDLFDEPSILNKESVRLTRYAVSVLDELDALEQINKEALIQFLLRNYKSPSNAIGNLKGFSALPNSPVTLRSTLDSVIILRKLKALGVIDSEAVAQLILAYQNDDGGFWDPDYPEFGKQPTLKATANAVLSLMYLDKLNSMVIKPESQEMINNFVADSWSSESKLFAPFPGHPPTNSYDIFYAWVSVYYLPINQENDQIQSKLLHLEELIESINSQFKTSDNVYSEEINTDISSLKATRLISTTMKELGKLDVVSTPDIVSFIKEYRDPRMAFTNNIYTAHSAVKTLEVLASTRKTKQLNLYKVLTLTASIVALLLLTTLITFQRKVRSRRHRDLVRQAQSDRLTGLHNRYYLEMQFERYSNTFSHMAFVLIDVDHFKSINDELGHLVGDEVLIELSELLRRNTRKTDTLARWGGEEFAILCPETEPSQAETLAEKLRCMVESNNFNNVGKITCSFGISWTANQQTLRELYLIADKALYQSKRNGRNQVTYL